VRVLFVVDNVSELPAAEAMSHQRFETEVVDVGRQVPGMIREYDPDVLVLDVALPHLNGVTVAELLREDWPHLPIVLASDGFDPAESPLPALTEYLPKPYCVDGLVQAIQRLTYRLSISDL
jgi:DNA-binding response OmpR family regulator